MINLKYWAQHPQLIIPRLKFWFYERRNAHKPWLCHGTIEFLDEVLRPDMIGLEFGSGRSTQWFAKRLKTLVSVEHSRDWHAIVAQQLNESNITNVDYRLIPLDHPESEPERQFYEPLPRYVNVLDIFADGSVDFILVDGHYRSTCIKKALAKIRPNRYLAVDDCNLWNTLGGPPVPSSWKCVDTSSNGIKTAKVWQRPAD